MSRDLSVLHVDVFTARPFAGNPAGVVLDADGLTAAEMRQIAAELRLPATAFVARTDRAAVDLGLRWFSPSGDELGFCGHGTVAATHALCEGNRVRAGRVVFDTKGGVLPVAVEGSLIWLEPALRSYAAYAESPKPVLDAFGLTAEAVAGWAPISLSSDRDLLIPVTGFRVLESLSPDLERLARLGRESGLRGFCLTARETREPDATIHSRYFIPQLGIPEDVTTGSLHAALPVWLWDAGVLKADRDLVRFRAEQGDLLGRPGRLAVELRLDGGRPAHVRVGGEAVTVLSGTLRLP